MSGIRGHLTYANVMATVAVCLALGGGAYAAIELGRNDVKSKHIARNAVKNSDLAASALKCPRDMRRIGTLCFEKVARAGMNHDSALMACASRGRELPTLPQLLRFVHRSDYPAAQGEVWTSSSYQSDTAESVEKHPSGFIEVSSGFLGNNTKVRCVREATP